jgi:two-component system chemotaxis response regulator CheB
MKKDPNTHVASGGKTESVATLPPSKRAYDMVVVAASLGGIKAIGDILSVLPTDFPVPIAVVQHRTAHQPNYLAEVLGRRTKLPVRFAQAGEPIHAGTVYVAPPDSHLTIGDHTFHLSDGKRIRHVLSSANPMFTSAAEAFKGRMIAVVLTGGDRDGTDGVQSVRNAGGFVIAQDKATCEDYSMPHSAIDTGCVNEVLPLEEIGPEIVRLVMSPKDQAENQITESRSDQWNKRMK